MQGGSAPVEGDGRLAGISGIVLPGLVHLFLAPDLWRRGVRAIRDGRTRERELMFIRMDFFSGRLCIGEFSVLSGDFSRSVVGAGQ